MIGAGARRRGGRRPLHQRFTSPARTEVYNPAGALLATFTDGAKIVTLAGSSRTFTETKPDITDMFARTASNAWGTSPTGGKWDNFGGADADFSVSAGLGRIAVASTNTSRYVRLDDTVAGYDVRMKCTLSAAPAGAANSIALVGGWSNTTDHYRFRLTFGTSGAVTAAITRVVAGTETNISGNVTVAASGFVADQYWWIRATYDGATLAMYAWKDGDSEPGSPTTSIGDTTFPTGKLGLRAFTSTGATNAPQCRVDSYTGTATWPTAVSVTHSTWVRLLSAPFTGVVNHPWLVAALADTSDDLLAVAMQYLSHAPDVMDGPLRIGGDAAYGPLDATTGARIEGADFNDYLGIPWTYTGTDNPEAAELGCLDCSGFLRMVFGYRGERGSTLPLSLTDLDGVKLPRASRDQLDSGPGVVVVPRTGAQVTDFTTLRVGDIVGFDATSDLDEYDGEIDHVGVFLGIDGGGHYRFISSRKTPNGPTFADLGGPSYLDGSGLYARKLRIIRRF